MIHNTLTINPQTICWHGVGFVDWASAGRYYSVEGKHYDLAFSHSSGVDWDACVASPDGRYALIFARLGTKALLLKEGELLREVAGHGAVPNGTV